MPQDTSITKEDHGGRRSPHPGIGEGKSCTDQTRARTVVSNVPHRCMEISSRSVCTLHTDDRYTLGMVTMGRSLAHLSLAEWFS